MLTEEEPDPEQNALYPPVKIRKGKHGIEKQRNIWHKKKAGRYSRGDFYFLFAVLVLLFFWNIYSGSVSVKPGGSAAAAA